MHHTLKLFALAALLTANPALAQSETILMPSGTESVARLTQPIEFDGHVDDAAWNDVHPLPLVRHMPAYDRTFSEESDVRIAYDAEYLYLAARCFDSMPMTETTYKRDDWSAQDDQIAITIDAFNDHESALVFVLYSTGSRIDATVSNDARTTSDINSSWNTFWDAEVSRDERGWYGEIRIPWSSLRFQPNTDGTVTMGVSAYRFIARLREMHVYPDIPPDWGFWSFVKPSKTSRTTFNGLQAKRPLYVTPYIIGGLGQDFRPDDAEARFVRIDNPTYDAGLDLKYGLTSNLTLDLTVNTDFAQVEADDQQVNLTRFSLFFPEKRQFFLERTTTFDFSFDGVDRVFYSRKIGINDGRSIQLLGGGRLVGRIGAWDVGVLTMQSARDRGIPSENFGVARLKRQVINPNSFVGAIATSRTSFDGSYNAVYGVDGSINLVGDDYLRLNWAQSFEPDLERAVLGNSRFSMFWQRAREIGLVYSAGVSRAGADYRPGIGFQLRENFTELTGTVGAGWRPESSAHINKQLATVQSSSYFRNTNGTLETAQVGALYSIILANGTTGQIKASYYYEDLLNGFSLSNDAEISAGRYRFVDGALTLTTSQGQRLRGRLNAQAGGFFDGSRTSASISPEWSISAKLQLAVTYGYDRVRFPDRDQLFDAHLLRARADLMLSTKLSISSFIQYNSSIDAAIANVRLRINPREGNDFYLVFNGGFNTDRHAYDPRLPFSSSRTIIAKYTYTFLR